MENSKLDKYINECEGDAMDIARCIIDEKLNSIQKKQVEDITSLFPVLNIKVDKAEIMRQINEIRKKKDEDTDG